ncbi:hypothetical protein CS549_10065 [Porphyromonas gingivalis]|uniref:Uncharacterized protein n=1 Tax=Porphyromonas gingivalis F0570 TaxID=1227271 RepID=A0A0E2LSK7_PORGN|nr:hypothetical protein CS549_10065 [Porphyromonas gingivalis]ATS05888.1 hypothetical protein CS387_02090 [Porphyromonas gingivalis]ERJ68518.1 hypothetical protein HMPREF1555_00360 [Porphyromonas gingivalis F0570]
MRPAYHDAKLQFFLYVAHFHSDSFATVPSGSAVTTSANSLFGSFSTFVFDKAYIGKNTWHPKALLYEYNYKTQTAKKYIHIRLLTHFTGLSGLSYLALYHTIATHRRKVHLNEK